MSKNRSSISEARSYEERSIEADGVRIEIVPVSRFLSVQKIMII